MLIQVSSQAFETFIGHLHPLLVHLPIGIFLFSFIISILKKEQRESLNGAFGLSILIGSISALASCIAGYILAQSGDYNLELVTKHQWTGISTCVLGFVAYFWTQYRRILVWASFGVMAVAGHLGGTLTHGEGYFFSTELISIKETDSTKTSLAVVKMQGNQIEVVSKTQEIFLYRDQVSPILQNKCYACHSEIKMKNGLRLDSESFIKKGGKNGKILVSGNPNKSLLYTHLKLPLIDEKHMPPKGKRQLSENEITVIHNWIEKGSPFGTIIVPADTNTNANSIATLEKDASDLNQKIENKIHPFKANINGSKSKENNISTMPEEVEIELQKISFKVDYNQHIKPILSDKCFACHGPDKAKQKAGLRLDQANAAYAYLPESPTKVALSPRNLAKSEVFHRIISTDPEYLMPIPKSHLSLTSKEKAYLIKWIKEGAVYQTHWAFVKPLKKEIPKLPAALNPKNEIDNFVFSKLSQNNLTPSKEASKELLLRRVSLDLTGLPPTIEEIDDFVNDKSPNAYEKQVDRLLKSTHYGEKMAADWLDLARFADSHGYTVDRLRDMSPYRDWVINSFNNNMPYNTFIHQQLAGDLMPNPTKEMIIATAFNRNHPQNMEGGIVEEEFQTEYVMDRTNTLGDAFMALSVGCARCHDHKYDPISQKNYYELYSFFNNVGEAGQISWNDDLPTPTLMLPSKEQEKVIAYLQNKIDNQETSIKKTKTSAENSFEKWLSSQSYKSLSKEEIPKKGLQGFYQLNGNLINHENDKQVGSMKHENGKDGDSPLFQSARDGKILSLDGDVYLDLKEVGVFRKSEPFSIGMWVMIPKDLKEGVIFHKSDAERLYNFKGFNLSVKNNKFEITMAHTAPSNALIRISEATVPRNKWIHVNMNYDGSSKASGFKLFLDGSEMVMETYMDQLYKDIIFYTKNEPALQVGGWWRGLGFKGGKVDDITIYNRELTPFEIEILANKKSWSAISSKSLSQLSISEKNSLKNYYLSTVDKNMVDEMQTLTKWRSSLADSTEKIPEIMVMQELPKPKKSTIFLRGQYNAPGQEVFPNTPSSVLSFPKNLPKNRLGLAQWLTNDDHPLTSRVAANRMWQIFFGAGLVKTSEDFGNQGEMPSHPELLDWLAVQLRETGWDLKELNKKIVMSATYRQDSYTPKSLRDIDPENRLLSRGPTNRLSAEMIRDNALAASGLLNRKIGGASVKPYQPDGLWEINSANYKQDTTDAVYRRSLYVIVKRSVPNPTLSIFDASSRSSCLVRRQKTNTPVQALVTLNDPGFIEAAKVMGELMSKEKDEKKSIQLAYRKLTGVYPTEKETTLLNNLYNREIERFKHSPDKTKGWLNAGMYKLDAMADKTMIAANAVVASTILNSDATITKR